MVDLGGIVVIGSSGVLVMLAVCRVVSCSFSRLVSRMRVLKSWPLSCALVRTMVKRRRGCWDD